MRLRVTLRTGFVRWATAARLPITPRMRSARPWRQILIGAYVTIALLLAPLIWFHYELRPAALRILMIIAWPVELVIWIGLGSPR